MTMPNTKRRVRRLLLIAVSMLCTMSAGLVTAPASSGMVPPSPGCAVRKCITGWAEYEYSNTDGHKYEKPLGSNCNYFSKDFHDPGATNCPNAWWSEEWCMDFARWVYLQSGANVSGLTHLASSAKSYGQQHGTWSTSGAHLGDLALWNPAQESHVGIVVAIPQKGTVTVISGNSYNPATGDYTAIYESNYSTSTFEGFAGPA